ncbi:MAG TPA: glycosyltransferase [Chroococcidiopsis sp.]
MNSRPLISVAVCTFNRADRLVLALDGLRQQSLPVEQFEVLVVDNASTDHTKAVCDRYLTEMPNLRYLYEPVKGLSKARNTAIAHSQADYIAYLDDDAIPAPAWVQAIVETFSTVEPAPVSVGGPIYPLWEIPKPVWVHKYMEGVFTILDCGNEPMWFKKNQFPYGANMAYHKPSLEAAGSFSEKLGRQGKNLLSHEEYLLNLTLEQQGGRFYYNPKAAVQHWVPKERIDPHWLIRRSYWQGRSEALVEQIMGKTRTHQRWASLRELANLKRLVAQVLPDPQIRVTTRARLAWSWGYFAQVWFNPST